MALVSTGTPSLTRSYCRRGTPTLTLFLILSLRLSLSATLTLSLTLTPNEA